MSNKSLQQRFSRIGALKELEIKHYSVENQEYEKTGISRRT
jgi:predicted DNA-binding protein with PD1-like motif